MVSLFRTRFREYTLSAWRCLQKYSKQVPHTFIKYGFIFPTNFQIVGDAGKITALAKFLTVCLDYRLLVF